MKRICLFAGYNSAGTILPYVIDYLLMLRKHCDIYYMADGNLQEGELTKLDGICKGAWVENHGKYDFGSYSELAKSKVGWAEISKYDELIFANDSCFCLNEFSSVFEKMQNVTTDAWGLLATDENNKGYLYTLEEYLKIPAKMVPLFCVGSYFLVFRKNVIDDGGFRQFINAVDKENDRHSVCIKYEMGLTKFLQKKGFIISAYVEIVYRNVTIYDEQAFRLLKKGFPLLKCRIFKDNPLSIQNLPDWPKYIAYHTKSTKIYDYLHQIGFNASLTSKREIAKECLREMWLPPIVRLGWRQLAKLVAPPKLLAMGRRIREGRMNKAALPITGKLRNSADSLSPNSVTLESSALLEGYKGCESLIIHFNVARDVIGGGVLSINRFVKHTADVAQTHGYKLLVSGLPLENPAVAYSMFEPALPMVHFFDITRELSPKRLILHIPECYVAIFIAGLSPTQRLWLKMIPWLQINIMDQNHDLFPDRYYIECCRELTDDVTITTAHLRYTTQEVASQFDCPVSLLTPFLPDFYRTPFGEKEKIIVVSPDNEVPAGAITKDSILARLKEQLPDYRIIVIQNMTIEEYKRLISKARFAITFGEGYDGYYLEPFLSGSVAFAVYNKTFFPKEFKDAPTIYQSWEECFQNIVLDIRRFEGDSAAYEEASSATELLIKKYTNCELSMQNLEDFYGRKFSYLPEIYQADQMFVKNMSMNS